MNFVTTLSILLTVPTGFSGLLYEVVWHRYLSNLLGSQARASAIILAIFLGGLSLGYFLFGKISTRFSRRGCLLAVALLEVIIGVYGYLSPKLLVFYSAYSFGDSLFDELFVSSLLLLPPTIAMGGTLPFLTQALSPSVEESSQIHSRLYGTNTAGGFIGCLVSGIFLVPQFGLPGTIWFGVLGNLLPAVGFIVLSRYLPSGHPEQNTTPAARATGSILPDKKLSYLTVSFLAGFLSLTFQVILIRLVSLSVGASEYSFSLVVSVFILFLALGPLLLTPKNFISTALPVNQAVIWFGLVVVYLLAPSWTYGSYLLRTSIGSAVGDFHIYILILFLVLSLIVAIPIGAMGRTLPLLFSAAKETISGLGETVGHLYGVNTLGCVIGALGGGFLSLFVTDLDTLFRILLVVVGCTVLITAPKRNSVLLAGALLVILPAGLSSWDKRYLASGLFRFRSAESGKRLPFAPFYSRKHDRELLFYNDGPNTTVAVIESLSPSDKEGSSKTVRSLWVNGKSDGATAGGDLITTRLLAHLPSLFVEKPEKAAVIGFGTGITSGSFSLYPEMKQIDTIEISHAVKEASLLFSDFNHQITAHPRFHWVLKDAFRHFRDTSEEYDVISSEPSNPWMAGIERLFTTEFYSLAHNNLSDRGVFAQWIQLYALSTETFEMVVRNFTNEFPFSRIYILKRDAILLGADSPLEVSTLSENFKTLPPRVRAELREINLNEYFDLLPFSFPLPSEMFTGHHPHSLEYPKLAHAAGKDFFYDRRLNILDLFSGPKRRRWKKEMFHKIRRELNSTSNSEINRKALLAFIAQHCDTPSDLCELMELYQALTTNSYEQWSQKLSPDEQQALNFLLGIEKSPHGVREKDFFQILERYGALISEEVLKSRITTFENSH